MFDILDKLLPMTNGVQVLETKPLVIYCKQVKVLAVGQSSDTVSNRRKLVESTFMAALYKSSYCKGNEK